MTIPYMMNCSHSGDGWCLACVQELDEERRRLADFIAAPEKVRLEYAKETGVKIEVEHWAVKMIVHSLADSVGPAPNFVSMELTGMDGQVFDVVIKRKHGKSTSQVLAEVKDKVKKLREALLVIEQVGHNPADNLPDLIGQPDRYEKLSEHLANIAQEAYKEISE